MPDAAADLDDAGWFGRHQLAAPVPMAVLDGALVVCAANRAWRQRYAARIDLFDPRVGPAATQELRLVGQVLEGSRNGYRLTKPMGGLDGVMRPVTATVTVVGRDPLRVLVVVESACGSQRIGDDAGDADERGPVSTVQLERIASVIGHGLRQEARLASTYLDPELPGDHVGHRQRARLHLARLLDGLGSTARYLRLGLGRPTHGSCRPEEVLPPVVERVHQLSGIAPVVELGETASVPLTPAQGEAMLLHLLLNAVQHHGPGSVRISITAHHESARCLIGITDDGPGIPPGVIEALRHPTANSRLGGLDLCFGIAGRQGGDLWFDRPSEPGCRVRIMLPLPDASA